MCSSDLASTPPTTPILGVDPVLLARVKSLLDEVESLVGVLDSTQLNNLNFDVIQIQCLSLQRRLIKLAQEIGSSGNSVDHEVQVDSLNDAYAKITAKLTTMLAKLGVAAQLPPQPQVSKNPFLTPLPLPSPMLRTLGRQIDFHMRSLRSLPMRCDSGGKLLDLGIEQLREAVDLTLPRVKESVKELNTLVSKYAAIPNHDPSLVEEVLTLIEEAAEWLQYISRCQRTERLHLDGATKVHELTTSVFKPGGPVTTYEFIVQYELYASEHLTKSTESGHYFICNQQDVIFI